MLSIECWKSLLLQLESMLHIFVTGSNTYPAFFWWWLQVFHTKWSQKAISSRVRNEEKVPNTKERTFGLPSWQWRGKAAWLTFSVCTPTSIGQYAKIFLRRQRLDDSFVVMFLQCLNTNIWTCTCEIPPSEFFLDLDDLPFCKPCFARKRPKWTWTPTGSWWMQLACGTTFDRFWAVLSPTRSWRSMKRCGSMGPLAQEMEGWRNEVFSYRNPANFFLTILRWTPRQLPICNFDLEEKPHQLPICKISVFKAETPSTFQGQHASQIVMGFSKTPSQFLGLGRYQSFFGRGRDFKFLIETSQGSRIVTGFSKTPS